MHTSGGSSGVSMAKRGRTEGVNGAMYVGGKGTGEVEAEGLGGPVARESGVVGEAVVSIGEKVLPCCISSREKTLDSGWAGCRSVGRIGSGVEVIGAPVRGWWTGFGA